MTTSSANATAESRKKEATASAVPSWRVLATIVVIMAAWTATMWAILGAFLHAFAPGGW